MAGRLGRAGPADSAIGLDSYIDEYLRAVVATVTEATGSDAVTLLGHCQGGTFAAIYAALHPDEVRNLILLAAPIDFVPSRPSAVGSWSLWSRQRWYDPRALLGPNGNVPVHLAGRAVAARSAPVAIAAPWLGSLRARMATSEEGRVWLSACQWVDDSPPLSGTAWVQWLAGCYQRNDLVHGRRRIGDRRCSSATSPRANGTLAGRALDLTAAVPPPRQIGWNPGMSHPQRTTCKTTSSLTPRCHLNRSRR